MENFTPSAQSTIPAPVPRPSGGWGKAVAGLIFGLLLGSGLVWYMLVGRIILREPEPTPSPTPSPQVRDLEAIFGMDSKVSGTELVYVPHLGIGFTWLFDPELHAGFEHPIRIEGNTVRMFGQSVEVFSKDSAQTLSEAIEEQFLVDYDPANCFVEDSLFGEDETGQYVFAQIAYPPPSDPNEPIWANQEQCPVSYSRTNGVAYFMMNTEVPDRFVYFSIGQEAVASDGTPKEIRNTNWHGSLQILER